MILSARAEGIREGFRMITEMPSAIKFDYCVWEGVKKN